MKLFLMSVSIFVIVLMVKASQSVNYTASIKAEQSKKFNEANRNETCPCNIKSNFDMDSFLMTSFGIGLRVHNRTGRVCKTRSKSNFVPWKIERRGNCFTFKGPSGYLGRKASMYNNMIPDCQKERPGMERIRSDSSSPISKSIHDLVVGNAEEPTEWSIFVHLPDRRLLLTNKKDVLTFDRRCLAMSSDIRDAKLLTLANVPGMDEDEDMDDLLAEEESDQVV